VFCEVHWTLLAAPHSLPAAGFATNLFSSFAKHLFAPDAGAIYTNNL